MGTATKDPTLQSLEQLKDKSRWHVIPGVPVFEPHRRKAKGKDGKEKEIVVTEARLHEIVANARRLERERGVVPGLWLGHRKTDPDADEEDQPDMVGLAPNWRVGKWGPDGKTAILADLYYDLRELERAKKFPFRSAEFYDGSDEITGVALLKRDPQLDLGMILFARDGSEVPVFYAADGAATADPPDERPKAPPPGAGPDGADEDEDDADPAASLSPEGQAIYAACMAGMKKYMGGQPGAMVPPGGANGQLPLPPPIPRPGEQPPGQMQRDGVADNYSRVRFAELEQQVAKLSRKDAKREAELQNLKQQNRSQATQYARDESQLIVSGLIRDDYQLSDAEALELVEEMTPMTREGRQAYERKIRDKWAKAPTERDWHPATMATYARQPAGGARDDGAGAGSTEKFTEEHRKKAEHYCRLNESRVKDHEQLWEEAEEYAMGRRTVRGEKAGRG